MVNNVDIIYKTVLSILNKEQRGYMTPSEFNNIARQVQLEIFEKNFEDLNQALRMPENDSEYANREKLYEENISYFQTVNTLNVVNNSYSSTVYRLGSLLTNYKNVERELQQVTQHELNLINKSKLTKPSEEFPAFSILNNGPSVLINVYPSTIPADQIDVSYIRFPIAPTWGFTQGNVGQYIYNETNSTQFEISMNNFTDIVLNVLMYAGVVIRDPQIIQAAAGQIAQENANKKS